LVKCGSEPLYEAIETATGAQADFPVLESAEIGRAVEGLARAPNGGLAVMPDSFTMTNRELIVAQAARHRVPAVYPFDVFVQAGGPCLLSRLCQTVESYPRGQ
jgi:putative ABC transport system substrate-binding protein